MELTIDQREPDSVYSSIYSCPDWGASAIRTELLDSGDFILQYRRRKNGGYKQPLNLVGIESKTWSDLAGSLSTKANAGVRRMTKQLTMLQATYPIPLLLVKGTYDTWSFEANPYKRNVRMWSGNGSYHDSGWMQGMLEGFLLSVQDRGIRVVQVADEDTLPYALAWLWKHYEHHDPDQDVDHFSRGYMVPITMLDAIPGVGPLTARKLHEELDKPDMDSIGGVIRASEEKLAAITNGVVAREIRKRLS